MRLALAQLNATVGDLHGNAELVRAAGQRAVEAGADLLLTPELVLTGYPPQDLLFKPHFIQAQLEVLEGLAHDLPVPALIGCVYPAGQTAAAVWSQRQPAASRPALSNAAALVRHGRVEAVSRKMLLPTYDVFDEWRYFQPGEPHLFSLGGQQVGVTVCEDLWDNEYAAKPASSLAAAGAQLLVNLSASPYHSGHFAERLAVAQRHARQHGVPVAYCNLVGGQDELIFDGRSFVLAGDGGLCALAQGWAEDLLVVDLPTGGSARLPEPEADGPAEQFAALVLGVRDYARKCGFTSAVLGLSGGVDSALVSCIAAEALGPANIAALAMPGQFTAAMSNEDAQLLARALGIELHTLPIDVTLTPAAERFQHEFGPHRNPVTLENMQSRERGQILMEFSNDRGALLLTTGNKTEYALGYTTLYGDMCGGLAVIGDLSKPEVYELCRWYNARTGRRVIPARILLRPPSAELAPDQIDPFDYDVIAPLTELAVEQHLGAAELVAGGYAEADVERVLRLVRLSEYKRKQAPPILRVSPKAFGIGRRMPIVNRFAE